MTKNTDPEVEAFEKYEKNLRRILHNMEVGGYSFTSEDVLFAGQVGCDWDSNAERGLYHKEPKGLQELRWKLLSMKLVVD